MDLPVFPICGKRPRTVNEVMGIPSWNFSTPGAIHVEGRVRRKSQDAEPMPRRAQLTRNP